MSVEELVVQNAVWISQTARLFYSDSQDADDLAGETIYKCLNQSHTFNLSRSFKPWALTVMRNTYISQYNRRKCVLFTDYECHDTCGSDYADQYVIIKNILDIINECSQISCCIECVMLYAQGYNYKEIAEIIGISVEIVRSRLAGGRKVLAKALKYSRVSKC